jgi:hypothetical protein
MASQTAYRVEVIPVQRIEQQPEIYHSAVEHWISDGIPRGEASCFNCNYQWKALKPSPPLAFVFIRDHG